MTLPDVQETGRCGGQMLLMLPMLVSLLFCVSTVKACLECDPKTKLMLEHYAETHPTTLLDMKKSIRYDFQTFRETSQRVTGGVIDATAMYKSVTEFKHEFGRFSKNKNSFSDIFLIGVRGNEVLAKHLEEFQQTRKCPNKCGFLERRVVDCFTCKYKMYTCPSPTNKYNCGEFPVQAVEGDQALLDCSVPWHRLIYYKPEYHFSWAPGVPGTKTLGESDFKPLVVTQDSFAILNQLRMEDQGTYRCSLQGKGTILYQVTFLVTVTPLPTQTLRPFVTPPVLPTQPPPDPTPIIYAITSLSLASSVCLVFIIRLMSKRRRNTLKLA